VFKLWLYIEGARNDSNQTMSDIYKNVEGYFFKTVCCSSCLYKSQFQVERVRRNANCIGSLGRLVFIYCRSGVHFMCLNVLSPYPKIRTSRTHKIV
jgi:hypothetical protein